MDLLNLKPYSCSGHLYSINYSLIQNYSLKINTKHLTTVTSVKHVILYGNGSDSLIWLIRIRDPKIFENVKTTKPKNILKVIFFNYSYLRQNYTDWTNYLLKKKKNSIFGSDPTRAGTVLRRIEDLFSAYKTLHWTVKVTFYHHTKNLIFEVFIVSSSGS